VQALAFLMIPCSSSVQAGVASGVGFAHATSLYTPY
jgi:hypothetical protein